MIVKNISGSDKTLTFSNEVSHTVANGGTMVVPDSPQCVADALKFASRGIIEIVKGTPGSQLLQSVNQPERILFVQAGQPSDGDTLVYGDVTIEWDSNSTVTSGNVGVTIGANAGASLKNLFTALTGQASLEGHRAGGVVGTTTATGAMFLPEGDVASTFTVTDSNSTNTTTHKLAEEAGESLAHVVLSRVATTATLSTDVIFSTDLSSVLHAEAYVYDASYAPVAWDGAPSIDPVDGGGVIVLSNGGSVKIANGHTVVVLALGKV